MSAAEWDDLARLAVAARVEGEWTLTGGRTPAGAEFRAAANPATILRLIETLRNLRWEVEQHSDGSRRALNDYLEIADRLAAVEALADDLARPFPDGVPDREGAAIAASIRAVLSAAPTDTTKET